MQQKRDFLTTFFKIGHSNILKQTIFNPSSRVKQEDKLVYFFRQDLESEGQTLYLSRLVPDMHSYIHIGYEENINMQKKRSLYLIS